MLSLIEASINPGMVAAEVMDSLDWGGGDPVLNAVLKTKELIRGIIESYSAR